ncbi:hypothetical protein ES708_21854 [subsurface metagenome]
MRFAGEMKDAGAQLVLQHLDRRKRLQRLRGLVEIGRDRGEILAGHARNRVLKKGAQWRTSPCAEMPFGIAQRVEHVDCDPASNLAGHRPGLLAAAEHDKFEVVARLRNSSDVGLLPEDVAESRNRRIAGDTILRQ